MENKDAAPVLTKTLEIKKSKEKDNKIQKMNLSSLKTTQYSENALKT